MFVVTRVDLELDKYVSRIWLMERDYQDIMEAVDYVIHAYNFVDPERIGVAEGSYTEFFSAFQSLIKRRELYIPFPERLPLLFKIPVN